GEVGYHSPRRVKLGTCRQDETESPLSALLNEQAQQFHGGGIEPVQGFHNEQDRLPLCFRGQPSQEDFQGFLALSLRRQREGDIGVGKRERQQHRQQWHGLGQRYPRCGQRGFQCLHWLGWLRPVSPPQQALELVDDGVQGALLVIERATPLNTGMWHSSNVLFQHLHQAGFANARLTAEQPYLPQPRAGLLPAPLKQAHFFVPPYKRGQATRRNNVEPSLRPTLVQHLVDL